MRVERGTVIDGRFRIEGTPSAGGMGAVYRAIDLTDNSVVAVKFLIPDAARSALDGWSVEPTLTELRRFEREIRLYERLGGAGVPFLVHHGRFRGRPYLVMQYIKGIDLRKYLNRNRRHVGVAVSVAVQILETLARVHEADTVHRDVKPHNILLESATGCAYLGDFGIALLTDHDATRYTEGQTPGTMGYKAPEVLDGEENPTGAADVYAVACLFFELAAGRPVFVHPANEIRMAQAHLREPPPRLDRVLPGFPSRLADLVDWMLAKDPAQRPSACRAAEAFRPYLPQPDDPEPDPAVDPDLTLPFRRPALLARHEPRPVTCPGGRSRIRRPGGAVDRAGLQQTLGTAYDEIHGAGAVPGPAADRLSELLSPAQRRWGVFDADVLTARVLVADRERIHHEGVGAGKRYRDVVRDLRGVAQPGEPAFAALLAARLGLVECRVSEMGWPGHPDEALSEWAECAAQVCHAPVGGLLGQRHLWSLIREIGAFMAECPQSDCSHSDCRPPELIEAVLNGLPDAGQD
ncbi:serine/threonine-protein kinase [Streptomyces sp. ISL-86]|uniref:serine/threonine protein kinase n=1 Tax=Streptomyces sp. ISL-86 TaxID=2819187 RepID=UPI001BECE302|nr:serine/threonine-protein kinase [Streptomyces sp. ISL-86]MBT2459358.1 serine/threonine protein kinase [Streptomyces sp. ISL-86]